MPNIVATIAEDALKVIEWPFQKLAKANDIIGEALKDTPALKAAVVGLIAKIEQLASDAATAAAADGLNFPADAVALAQGKELYSYVTGTFIPTVQTAIKGIEAAASTPAAPASTTTTTNGAKPKPPRATPRPGPALPAAPVEPVEPAADGK